MDRNLFTPPAGGYKINILNAEVKEAGFFGMNEVEDEGVMKLAVYKEDPFTAADITWIEGVLASHDPAALTAAEKLVEASIVADDEWPEVAPFVNTFDQMSPVQIVAWVDANINTAEDFKMAIKRLALLVADTRAKTGTKRL